MNRSSLGELVGLVIDHDLITHCSFSKESVSVVIAKLQLTLSPDDAHTLFRLILRGSGVQEPSEVQEPSPTEAPPAAEREPVERKEPERVPESVPAPDVSRVQPPAAEQPPVDTYHKRELFRASHAVPEEPGEVVAGGTAGAEQAPVGGDGGAFQEESISEEYLDSVLSFALTMQIIEGYTKDRESRTVTLRTGATTTGLSYWETLEYLTNSMLYELRPRTEQ